MQVVEILERIRPGWLSKVSGRVVNGEGVRQRILEELGRFYDALICTLESGELSRLNPVLDGWVQSQAQSELEQKQVGFSPLLNNIFQCSFEVLQASLSPLDCLAAWNALLPLYTYALDYTVQAETHLLVETISTELQKTGAELERLNKTKSDFISVAAHELKTPLTLIEGYTSMLRESLHENPQLPYEPYLKGIDSGYRRLQEIIDDMIDVSMIDNDLLAISFQPIWLNRLLAILENDLSDLLGERHQTLTIYPFVGSDEMTYGDGERLLQAFRNLFTNAIKYTPDGGKITVDGRPLPGFVEITITDTGIGIDPQDHNRIFEKFGRLGNVALHSSSKTRFKGGGPGLGLPITKGIIEAHGGAIWVESKRFDEVSCPGSTFHVVLPVLKSPPDDKTARFYRSLTESSGAKISSETVSSISHLYAKKTT